MKRTKYIETKQELTAEIMKLTKRALNKLGDKLLDELSEQILKDTYNADYMPNMVYYGGKYGDDNYGFYEPTYEFLEAWNKTINASKAKNESSISIGYNPKALSAKPHRSIVTGKDVRKNLANMLDVEGYTSSLEVGSMGNPEMGIEATIRNVSKYRRPYWKNFMNKLRKRGLMRKLIQQSAKEEKLKLE